MIIISQDKNRIVNFDNVNSIMIGTKNEIWIDTEKACNLLGKYKSEERAKEVLKKIIQTIEDTSIVNLMENLQISIHDPNFGGSLSSVYYMPEE